MVIGHLKEKKVRLKHYTTVIIVVLIIIGFYLIYGNGLLYFLYLYSHFTKKVLVCPVCNYGLKVNKKNNRQIMEDIENC